MQVYYAPGTIALATLIALEEAGAKYTPMRLSFADDDQKSDSYLALNPKGRVPTVVTNDGILTETPAILTWIAQTHPEANLLPTDAFAAAQVQEICAYLCSTVHVSHAHRVRGARWSDDPAVVEALKLKVAQNMGDQFAFLEERFQAPWVADAYSIADPYLFTIARWLAGDGVDIARFPGIAGHQARMEARPAVQRALKLELAT